MWIDLQAAAVALAEGAGDDDRRELACALLQAIVEQPCFGPADPLSRQAFALVLDAAPDELAASLRPGAGHTYGGRRYLQRQVWSLRGPEGARWMGVLARADPAASPPAEIVSPWTAEEWSDRLDVVAGLPVEPRPALLALVVGSTPRSAMPAVVRVVIAHADDELDPSSASPPSGCGRSAPRPRSRWRSSTGRPGPRGRSSSSGCSS